MKKCKYHCDYGDGENCHYTGISDCIYNTCRKLTDSNSMTREETRQIKLETFLYYLTEDEPFQLCFEGDEWDDYVELKRDSPFLKPFLACRIDCMGSELMDNGNEPTIRISIDDSNMVYLDE